MANNRLYLSCLRCGELLPLARLQVGMGSEWLPARIDDNEREKWYRTHSACGAGQGLLVALESENDWALSIA